MRYIAVADTDTGIRKSNNQDSLLINHAMINNKEVLVAIVCDGMGGLEKGELASATVIRDFDNWFEEELPDMISECDIHKVADVWLDHIVRLNLKIMNYANDLNITMGTTFTGVFFMEDHYFVVHVGDTRLYRIDSELKQITEDQTFVAREIKRGNMTAEEAKTDKRRNMLLQCVGACDNVNPEVIFSGLSKGVYMLCSDGFRHVVTEQEIYEAFNPDILNNKTVMHNNVRYMIDLVKQRREKDNISVILIKVE